MSDSDDADLDRGQTDASSVSLGARNSLVNVFSSRTQRLGTGASRVFMRNNEGDDLPAGVENHLELPEYQQQTLNEATSVTEPNHFNQKAQVRWQQSDSTSGYASANDLTPDNTAAEENASLSIPNVVGRCDSENSLHSSSSIELLPEIRGIQQPTDENFQVGFHDPPEDSESSAISQESTDPYEDIIEKVQRYSICTSSTCKDAKCKSGRLIVESLVVFIDESDVLTTNRAFFLDKALQTLNAIADHSEDCPELKCKLPLCYFYSVNNLSKLPWRLLVRKIKEEYFGGDPALILPGPSTYYRLSCRNPRKPVEGADFCNLTRIGNFGNCVIAHAGEERSEHWCVKRAHIVNDERMEHAVKVLEVVSQNRNPNILPHLWLLKQEQHLIYATPFMTTLGQKLSRHKGEGFRLEACWMLMQQMLNAAVFLHSNSILYLNWQCKNVVYEESKGLAKITNFTSAVHVPLADADVHEIMETLQMWMPPRLVPPEIYQEDHLGEKNDVWGIGCLLYEMATGSIIHEPYHHEDPSEVRELLTANPVVNLDRVQSKVLKQLLRRSLKVSWSDRLTLEDFQASVSQNLSECQREHS